MKIIEQKPLTVGSMGYLLDTREGRNGLMGACAVRVVRVAKNGRVQVQALQGAVRRPLWIDQKELA